MRTRMTLLAAFTVAAAAFASEELHQHSHDGSVPDQLELSEGKRWETDASLRKGMDAIRKLVEAEIGLIHENKLPKARYLKLSDKVAFEINAIFKTCKLSPKADAMLHVLLAQMVEGNNALKSAGQDSDRREGALKIIKALQKYPKYFDHPGWKPVGH